MKKDCTKLKDGLVKKCNYFAFVYYESNITSINITHGGLILKLQSMFIIPYRVCQT